MKNNKIYFAVIIVAVVVVGAVLFQSVLIQDAGGPKIDYVSFTKSLLGTKITINGSGFTASLTGINNTKVNEKILPPGNYIIIKDKLIDKPIISPDGKTLTAEINLDDKDKDCKEKAKSCKVKVVDAHGKSSNEAEVGSSDEKNDDGKGEHGTSKKGPTITTSVLPDANISMPYAFTLLATGGTPPYTWSATPVSNTFTQTVPYYTSALPTEFPHAYTGPAAALDFNATTGTLSGTPRILNDRSASTVFTFNAVVTDANGNSSSKQLTLTTKALASAVFWVEKGKDRVNLDTCYGTRLSEINLLDGYFSPPAQDPPCINGSTSYDAKYSTGALSNQLSATIQITGGTSPSMDVELATDLGSKMIYLPSVSTICSGIYGINLNNSSWEFYIAKDGSTYFGRQDHQCGYSDMSPEQALAPQNLARGASAAPNLSLTATTTDLSPNSMRANSLSNVIIKKVGQ